MVALHPQLEATWSHITLMTIMQRQDENFTHICPTATRKKWRACVQDARCLRSTRSKLTLHIKSGFFVSGSSDPIDQDPKPGLKTLVPAQQDQGPYNRRPMLLFPNMAPDNKAGLKELFSLLALTPANQAALHEPSPLRRSVHFLHTLFCKAGSPKSEGSERQPVPVCNVTHRTVVPMCHCCNSPD